MPRKSAALLKDAKFDIHPAWKDQIKWLRKYKPAEGTEEAWSRHVDAVEERAREMTKYDQLTEAIDKAHAAGKEPDDEVRAAWKESGKKYDQLINREMLALDKWRYQLLHKDDAPTEPSVPEEDVRAIIGASLSDKLDELQFTKNYGLLATTIAHSIRMEVSEGDVGEPPLCNDHKED